MNSVLLATKVSCLLFIGTLGYDVEVENEFIINYSVYSQRLEEFCSQKWKGGCSRFWEVLGFFYVFECFTLAFDVHTSSFGNKDNVLRKVKGNDAF